MRKLLSLGIVAITILSTSCSKTEVNNPGLKERKESIANMTYQEQKLAYSIMSPLQRYQLWADYLDSIHVRYQTSDQAKATFVSSVRNQISPMFFDAQYSQQTNTLFESIKNQAIATLDSIEIFLVLGNIDIERFDRYYHDGRHITRMPRDMSEDGSTGAGGGSGVKNCECTPEGDFCKGWLGSGSSYTGMPSEGAVTGPKCKDGGCDIKKEDCGWMWREDCTGLCKE